MSGVYITQHEERVRAHIKTVYDFASEMFPLHDPNQCVDDVFQRASIELRGPSEPEDLWNLLRFAIETTIERHPHQWWWQQNASLLVENLRASLPLMQDDSVAEDLNDLVNAFERMALREQSVVFLQTLSAPIPADAYRHVLGIGSLAANKLLARTERTLIELFEGSRTRSSTPGTH